MKAKAAALLLFALVGASHCQQSDAPRERRYALMVASYLLIEATCWPQRYTLTKGQSVVLNVSGPSQAGRFIGCSTQANYTLTVTPSAGVDAYAGLRTCNAGYTQYADAGGVGVAETYSGTNTCIAGYRQWWDVGAGMGSGTGTLTVSLN